MCTPEICEIAEVGDVEIRDFDIIKKASIKFSPGLNIILGRNGAGKTTVMEYLFENNNPNKMAAGNRIMLRIDKKINKTCLLIDGVLGSLDQEKLIRTLKNLENSNRQVIATMVPSDIDFKKYKINANIIDTNDFEFFKGPIYTTGSGATYAASQSILRMLKLEEAKKKKEEKPKEIRKGWRTYSDVDKDKSKRGWGK